MRTALLPKCLVAGFAALLALVAPTVGSADDSLRNEFYRSLAGAQSGPSATVAGPRALLVSGVIGPGSYDEFRAALMQGSPDLVVLDGPGGILGEALLIGEEVRRRKLSTLVESNRSCASACAIVFLSGRTKYLGAGAAVGLHAASYIDGRADPEATAVMAAYLRQVGVPNATLKRMARTAPSDIRWLTRAEQKALGIQVYAGR
jgi:membrane-bound ClpP family serine protease